MTDPPLVGCQREDQETDDQGSAVEVSYLVLFLYEAAGQQRQAVYRGEAYHDEFCKPQLRFYCLYLEKCTHIEDDLRFLKHIDFCVCKKASYDT